MSDARLRMARQNDYTMTQHERLTAMSGSACGCFLKRDVVPWRR